MEESIPQEEKIERYERMLNFDLFVIYRWLGKATKYRENTLIWGIDNGNSKASKDWACGSARKAYEYVQQFPFENRYLNICSLETNVVFGVIDIDIYLEVNPNANIYQMIDILMKYYCLAWSSLFPELEVPTMDDFMVLDASNDKKISKHIHGPFNYAWANIYHLKAFMCYIKNLMYKDGQSDPIVNECFIESLHEKKKIFLCDLQLYNRVVTFRLYGNTKIFQNRPLLCDTHYALPKKFTNMDEKEREYQLFLHSTICIVPPDIPIIHYPDEKFYTKILPKNAFQSKNKKKKKNICLLYIQISRCKSRGSYAFRS